jgi:hypothetical protein
MPHTAAYLKAVEKALAATISLMSDIDATIEAHGGFQLA